MAESNSGWGDLAEHDNVLAAAWDSYEPLPDPGENDALDAFCAAKHITIPALSRLGTRLSTDDTLAFAYHRGVKFRVIENGRRWAYPGSEFPRLKIVRAGARHSDTVLVAESETDAARLTMLYADCDVAVMPAGARHFTKEMADQLAGYALVVTATDDDEAGDYGAAKVAELLPAVTRLRPPGKDWAEYVGGASPLPEIPDPRPVSGLAGRSVDLGALIREGIPPVEYLPGVLAERMIYRAGVWLLAGHPKTGKTSLVTRVCIDAMRGGLTVVYLDYENGDAEAARRFMAAGADATLLSDRMIYVPFPGRLDWSEIGALADAHPESLWVVDSTRGVLRVAGLDEDRATDTAKVFDPLSEFALKRGVPVIVLDHVTKAATESSGYSRGSGDKLASVQAAYYLRCHRPFSETEVGEIELVRWAARSGGLAARHRFEVGDGEGNLTFRRLDAEESPAARTSTAVQEFLRALHPALVTQTDVEQSVAGTATEVRACLKALAADPDSSVVAVQKGRWVRYGYVLPADASAAQKDPVI